MRYLLFLPFLLFILGGGRPKEKVLQNPERYKVQLGHYLFFETRLSATNSKSCSSCHDPRLAFTDGYRKSVGVYGDLHHRNAPSLLNISGYSFFNWANTDINNIEKQIEKPLFGINPLEMGMDKLDSFALTFLETDSLYSDLMKRAYPDMSDNKRWKNVIESLAIYVSSLNSLSSPYDRFRAGEYDGISESARIGERLFFSERLMCSKCHVPPLFGSDPAASVEEQFWNIGTASMEGENTDSGLYLVTYHQQDKGKFRTPSLRNLEYTAPYFHNGSVETLEEVIFYFESGGKSKTGVKQLSIETNALRPFSLTEEERKNLINFLYSLSDSTVMKNPLFLNPLDNTP